MTAAPARDTSKSPVVVEIRARVARLSPLTLPACLGIRVAGKLIALGRCAVQTMA